MARNAKKPLIDEEERFLARVAWACEIEGITQAAAAERFGVTRLRVNRALGAARKLGIVRIHINSAYAPCAEAENELKRKYELTDAFVVPRPQEQESIQMLIGNGLGIYLSDYLVRPQITHFGISWGNTLNLATRFMKPIDRPDLEIVSVMGGLTQGSDLNSFEITTRLADICNAKHSYFTAPLYAGSKESRDILVKQDVFGDLIAKIRNADALAMATGDMSTNSLLVRDGLPSGKMAAELKEAGAVGDVLGYFLDADGQPLDHPINDRVIGIELDDLKTVPNVILAAGAARKVPIIRAILKRGVIDTFITDEPTAATLIGNGDR